MTPETLAEFQRVTARRMIEYVEQICYGNGPPIASDSLGDRRADRPRNGALPGS
jgi:hypothetical protein